MIQVKCESMSNCGKGIIVFPCYNFVLMILLPCFNLSLNSEDQELCVMFTWQVLYIPDSLGMCLSVLKHSITLGHCGAPVS